MTFIPGERHHKMMMEILGAALKAAKNIAKIKKARKKTPDYFWDDEASSKRRERFNEAMEAMENNESYMRFKAGQAQQEKMKAKYYEHLRKKPHFTFSEETQEEMKKQIRPTGPYGTIYGTLPNEWVQTKPPDPRKKIDLNKCKWKPQFTLDDVYVYSMDRITGRDVVIVKVPGLFEVEINMGNIRPEYRIFLNGNPTNNYVFVQNCIELNRIPYPVEELI